MDLNNRNIHYRKSALSVFYSVKQQYGGKLEIQFGFFNIHSCMNIKSKRPNTVTGKDSGLTINQIS